jgi:hypothetical protein
VPKSRLKVVPPVNGGVFAHDSTANNTSVQVDGGVLSWRDVSSRVSKIPNFLHPKKFPGGPNPGPVIPVVKVYLKLFRP